MKPHDQTQRFSIVHGIPLAEEKGIGALTLGGYLREVTERYGPREAACLRTGDAALRWTYSELWQRAVEVARALLACGIGKGTRVGILMTNRPEFLSSVFGTALAGGVATPMSTFSTAAELDVLLSNSGCSVLLLEQHVLKKDFAAILAELEPLLASPAAGPLRSRKFPFLRHLAMVDTNDSIGVIEGWQTFLARGAHIAPEFVDATAATVAPADPGLLLFSSGSTGKPKGILNAHRGACLQLWRWRNWLGLDESVRSLSANGFFFSGNFAWALGSTLSAGGAIVMQPTFQPEQALELMQAERVTFLAAWPHQWAQLTDAKNWLQVDLSALKYIDRKSPIAAHPTVHSNWIDATHAYGSTETFTLSTVYPANTPDDISVGSHGLPVAGMTFKIIDPLSGDILPLGDRGEIAVKGPTLMLGYIGIALDETLDADGFFRTGDGGYFDEQGRLFWEGRLNDIIKTGGANVSPVEVDAVLAKCPGVKITKTVGVPDELLGELVVACIVPADGVHLREDDVRSFAKQQLASYKVPRRVLFFAENELETTGSAKVKASALRELAAQRLTAEEPL
jgi:fatty-acyl-CoA synthase